MELNTSKTIVDNQYQSDKKSFQNCTESELVGYNDCPSFLFSNSQTIPNGRRNKKILRHRMSNNSLPTKEDHNKAQGNDDDHKDLSKVIEKIEKKISINSNKLGEKELTFYKKKYEKHLPAITSNTRYLRNINDIFLEELDSNAIKTKVHEWVTKEPSVSSWLVSLSKIV
ncbi:uncharacterized protein HGUI_03471 [Hanseniaspora guilliermondii]|uniref:Uncharacterized protein n=1 Tax=Hanseniaspora guilliermondii TaxID=56406 RepID=A0A1L0D2B1_9ASCO|nr:uncharacterized protein HGUI_03471 [Hanseniaspora guilliermondii]